MQLQFWTCSELISHTLFNLGRGGGGGKSDGTARMSIPDRDTLKVLQEENLFLQERRDRKWEVYRNTLRHDMAP